MIWSIMKIMKRFIALILLVCICTILAGSLVVIGSKHNEHGLMKLNVCDKYVQVTSTHSPAIMEPTYEFAGHSSFKTSPVNNEYIYAAPQISTLDKPPEATS